MHLRSQDLMDTDDPAAILPYLPRIHKSETGSLHWKKEIGYALKSLSRGPAFSGVDGPEALCDFINDLREQSDLPVLSKSALSGLSTYFDDLILRKDAQHYFESVLPFMADLALRLPDLLCKNFNMSMPSLTAFKTVRLRLLQPQQAGLVLSSQELAASTLACAFFCLYPRKAREEANLPYFNFDGLFCMSSQKVENKLHCIMHYFSRIFENMPQGMISFERKVLPRDETCGLFSPIFEPDASYWSKSSIHLCEVQVFENGTIEDQTSDALEVDFANRFLGGGVLSSGCVQEEIRFVISPELMLGMVFMPAMHANEAIEIQGAERFSYYDGYASTFTFGGDYVDERPRDFLGRRKTYILAIDALAFPGAHQYEESLLLRETNKAFCGFLDHAEKYIMDLHVHVDMKSSHRPSSESNRTGIATGNWGCGAFGGDVELKSLLQWIAASEAGRPFLHYYSFGDSHGIKFQKLAEWIRKEEWVVGEIWSLLIDYGQKRLQGEHNKGAFAWILPQIEIDM